MPSQPAYTSATRPLDIAAASIVVVLCLSWGFNQVATKLAIHDIPPLLQATIRSVVAAMIVAGWCRLRGIPLLSRDGSLQAGLAAGFFFGLEFLFIFQGLAYTTALRATLFIYLAPFFVVLGGRIFLPADKFSAAQWLGLLLSFAGMIVAFGLPTPAVDPRQALGDLMMVAGAIFWATTTLIIKSRLNERIAAMPSAVAIGALAYQTVWVVSVTFVIWFALIARYSANRLSVFSFLTPLFGVAAGHFVLGEPLTPAFGAAVALVAAGLVLVNKAK